MYLNKVYSTGYQVKYFFVILHLFIKKISILKQWYPDHQDPYMYQVSRSIKIIF